MKRRKRQFIEDEDGQADEIEEHGEWAKLRSTESGRSWKQPQKIKQNTKKKQKTMKKVRNSCKHSGKRGFRKRNFRPGSALAVTGIVSSSRHSWLNRNPFILNQDTGVVGVSVCCFRSAIGECFLAGVSVDVGLIFCSVFFFFAIFLPLFLSS